MNVISYSIYGNNNFYWQFLPCLIRAHHSLFEGWKIKFYHDDNLINNYYGNILIELEKIGLVELSNSIVKEDKHCKAMIRRMSAIWENKYDYVFCRDVDALPTGRERWAVEKFIQTGAAAHVINDHKEHNIPMLGGMIGFNVNKFLKIMDIHNFNDFFSIDQSNYDEWDKKGKDQDFLNSYVWNKVKLDSCAHRIKWKDQYDDTVPFLFDNIEKIKFEDDYENVFEESNKYSECIGIDGYNKDKALRFFHRHGNRIADKAILEIEEKLGVDAFKTF